MRWPIMHHIPKAPMGFHQRGFLASDITDAISKIRQEYAEWFRFLDELNADSMAILWAFKPKSDNEQHLVAAVLFCRAVQSYQGAIMMAERGMITEARTLVRNCAETAFALGAIALDRSFLGELIDGHFKHTANLARAYLEEQDLFTRLTAQNVLALKQQIADIEAEYPEESPKGINWKSVAKRVGMTILYNTVYRDTSSDAAHVTLDALNRHIIADEEENIKSLKFGPDDVDLESTLSIAVSALLHAMNGVVLISGSEPFALTQNTYTERWKHMRLASLERERNDK
jgi:hypothetical protein